MLKEMSSDDDDYDFHLFLPRYQDKSFLKIQLGLYSQGNSMIQQFLPLRNGLINLSFCNLHVAMWHQLESQAPITIPGTN